MFGHIETSVASIAIVRLLEEVNGKVKLSAKQKRALETASLGKNPRSLTVVSSADGVKISKELDSLL